MAYKLSDLCYYVKGKTPVASLTPLTYISTENMLPDKAGVTTASSLPTVDYTQVYQRGDVLVSNIRPYFKKIWQAAYDGGCSNDVLVFRANENCDPTFLYYVLADDAFFNYSMATSKGTKMPRGDKTAILEYSVPQFDIETQRKIGTILSALDKKISVNSKINDNLQQQLQALFREWFIDNPEAELWERGTFADLIERTISGDWGKDTATGNNTEMVYCMRGADIPEVKAGNKGKMPTRFILPKNYASKQLVAGDIVVEISGGSPTQSTGRAAVISDALLARYDKGMVCTNFCKALKPKTGYSMFVYHYWQYLYDANVFFGYENGTTGIKNLDISGIIDREKIVIPDSAMIAKFDEVCQSMYRSIYSNGLENEQLSTLRDTILPRLMVGEIDVSDIQI